VSEPSVNDIPDVELIRRAIGSIRTIKRPGAGVPRWSVVARQFCLGSTFAAELCRRHGFDPEQRVSARRPS
jgi:hypothetical protein